MDKKLYRERRAAGKRGQGDKPKKIVAVHTPKEWKVIKRAERLERGQK